MKEIKIIAAVIEVVFAIPILGGSIIMGFLYFPLIVALALHILNFLLCKKEGSKTLGSGLGVFTSIIGIIPVLGWTMHLITSIVLMKEFMEE